ncbi:MAG: SCO family protein [Actinobacteria bacterium]|nr:SCO family protein [Actinomycetota bacterium]
MDTDRPIDPIAAPLSRRRMLRMSALAAGAMGLAACSTDKEPAALSNESTSEAASLGLHPDGYIVGALPKPTIEFTDFNNQPYDLAADTDGRLTLLFFGYTSCPDQCPVYLDKIKSALRNAEGKVAATKVLFVGVDTARDTPEQMKQYLGAKNPDFIGLSAAPEAIDEALAGLLLPSISIPEDTSGNYAVGHPTQAVVFTADNLCHVMYPYDLRVSEWVEELTKLVDFDWSQATS